MQCKQKKDHILRQVDELSHSDDINDNTNEKQKLLFAIVPYISSLVIPLLKCMTDHIKIRESANHVFGNAIRLLPLERGIATIKFFECVCFGCVCKP